MTREPAGGARAQAPGQSSPTCQPARRVCPRSIACQAAQSSKRVPQGAGDPTCTTAYYGRSQLWWTLVLCAHSVRTAVLHPDP